jgi:hypothetical protein
MGKCLFTLGYRACKNFINILFMKDCYSDYQRVRGVGHVSYMGHTNCIQNFNPKKLE